VLGVAVIGEGGDSSWTLIDAEMNEDIKMMIEASAGAAAAAGGVAMATGDQPVTVTVDSDSEEEDVVVLDSLPSDRHINLTKAVRRRPIRSARDKN